MKLLVEILQSIGTVLITVIILTIFSLIRKTMFGKNDDNNDKGEGHRPMGIDMGG